MAASTSSRPRRAAVQASPYASSSTTSASTAPATNTAKSSSPSKLPASATAAASATPRKRGRPPKNKGKGAAVTPAAAAGKKGKQPAKEGAAADEQGENGEGEELAQDGDVVDGDQPEPAAPPAADGDAKMEDGEDKVEDKVEGEGEEAAQNGDGEVKNAGKEEKEDEACPACKGSKDDAVWVECDHCSKWYHWSCVSPDLTSTPENIDKWYCPTCVLSSSTTPTPLSTTYLPPPSSSSALPSTTTNTSTSSGSAFPLPPHLPPAPTSTPPLRKSQRATRTRNIDYANLDAHLPASVDKWTKVIAARTAEGKVVDGFEPLERGGGGFGRLSAEEVKDQRWLYGGGGGGEGAEGGGGEGFREPFVVESPEGLGMRMPDARITVRDVARLVGEKTPLEVIDCASQSSLTNWNLGQWADYYDDPSREKVRNVISLEVSETELGRMVEAPEVVRSLDWVDNCWPTDMKGPGEYPRVQKYCLMSVERCWTDWHVDFAGSSVFYHILRGSKTFYFIRPTAANLAAYERWSGSTERQESTWLGDSVDMVYKVELTKGNTAFIPTGWIHAVYTPSDSLVIGGNFLHSLNIPTQLRIYQIELATKVPRKFRFPHFVRLLWFVAQHYHARLSSHHSSSPSSPLPADLASPRVLEGLKQLSSFLIEQTTRFAKGANVSAERRRLARENIPSSKIPDPVSLSREFRKEVLKAKGEELDAECFLPHVAAPVVEEPPAASAGGGGGGVNGGAAANGAGAAPGAVPNGAGGAGTKRKASADPGAGAGGEGAMLPPASTRAKIKHAAASPAPYAALPPGAGARRPSSSAGGVGFSSPSPSAGMGFPPSSAGGALGQGQGEANIVGRQQIPVIQQTRMEERIDPSYPHFGARVAEVKESRSTQSVVRRWEVDPSPSPGGPAGAGAGGATGPVVETRTVITIIERVKWTGQAGGTLRAPYAPYAPYSAVSTQQQQGAAYQPQGVGPAAAPLPPQGASTLTPQQVGQQQMQQQQRGVGGAMNPAPYPAYGYPYHYNLPSGGAAASSPGMPSPNPPASGPSSAPTTPSVLQQPPPPQQQQQQQQPYAAPSHQQQQQHPQHPHPHQSPQLSYPPPASYAPQPSPYAHQPLPAPNPYAPTAGQGAPLPPLPPPPSGGFAPSASGGAMALALSQHQHQHQGHPLPQQQQHQQGMGQAMGGGAPAQPPFSAMAGASRVAGGPGQGGQQGYGA